MDIFSALQTSVSGLKAQSYAISNISGNIANSQTTGFKRIDTSFEDLIAENSRTREVAGTVLAQSQLTNTLQGNITATNVATNMALRGDGFFVVQQRTGDANNQATFTGQNLYTRRGDFTLDKSGYLVNGAGSYLQGQNIDPATGQVGASGAIQITNTTLAAKRSATITYGANLPSTPKTNASASSTSALYAPAGTTTLVTSTDGSNTTGQKVAADTTTTTTASDFIDHSIAGPTLTLYTDNGAPVTLTTRWAKIQDATAATPAVWNLFYASDTTVANNKSDWINAGTGVTFDAAGQLLQPSSGSLPLTDLTVNGTNLGTVKLAFDKTTLTQYASTAGAATTNALSQDGFAAGTLNDIAVSETGQILGTFSNGSVKALANIGIARFANPDALKVESGGNFAQTSESGTALAGLGGSIVVGSNIEQSNTDIADEFSKMIVTQQAYSANTRVMSTAQQMMSDLLNVIR
jgi:flagellar hook protein FlgE